MRILDHTSSHLVVQFNVVFGWILGAVGCGIAIILGVVALTSPEYDGSLEQNLAISLFCLLFLLISLPVFFKPTTIATFDKSNGYFTLERKWLWKNEIIQHSLQVIKNVEVIQKGRFGKARIYFRIIIELDSGERLPLSSMNYRPEELVRQTARFIRTFLGSK